MKTPNRIVPMFFIFIALLAGCAPMTYTSVQEPVRPTDEPIRQTISPMPVKITWYWNESNVQLPEDSYICQKIKQDLNIEYIHISPKGTDFEEKLELLISSGNIPDVITSYTTLTSNLIQWGVIQPVEAYLTPEYIPDVIRIQKNWDMAVMSLRREDGCIYAVPNCNDSQTAEVPFIRYDWLENLNLKVPETFDELRDVLIQFTYNDPDQNGEDDTIGTMANEYWGMVPYATNFAADHFEWYSDEKGGVTLGMFLPRHKEYLRYVKSLIDNGAIDRNIATTKFIEINDKMKAGKVGFLYQWYSHDLLKTDIPGNEPKKPYNVEFVSIPEKVAAFTLHWQFEEWPDFFYSAVLGKTDIDAGFDDFVSRAEEAGLKEINQKMEAAMRNCGIIQ